MAPRLGLKGLAELEFLGNLLDQFLVLAVGDATVVQHPPADDVVGDAVNQAGTQQASLFVQVAVDNQLLVLDRLVGLLFFRDDLLGNDRAFAVLGTGEDSGQAVVVFDRERVVLVIVTPGT